MDVQRHLKSKIKNYFPFLEASQQPASVVRLLQLHQFQLQKFVKNFFAVAEGRQTSPESKEKYHCTYSCGQSYKCYTIIVYNSTQVELLSSHYDSIVVIWDCRLLESLADGLDSRARPPIQFQLKLKKWSLICTYLDDKQCDQ